MIIDDDQRLCRSLSLVLVKAGYSTVIANSAEEAISCLQKEAIDLIFLDIKIPGVSGLELLDKIRSINPETPVLILTAYISLDMANQALAKNAKGYLTKPVFPGDLLSRVQQVLSEQKEVRLRKEIMKELELMQEQLSSQIGVRDIHSTSSIAHY